MMSMSDRLESNYDKVTLAIGLSGLILFSILGVGIYLLLDDTVEILAELKKTGAAFHSQ